jgi:hypothetical protein
MKKMKIRRLIATMLVSLALLVGLLAGGLVGVGPSVSEVSANPCENNFQQTDDGGNNNCQGNDNDQSTTGGGDNSNNQSNSNNQ